MARLPQSLHFVEPRLKSRWLGSRHHDGGDCQLRWVRCIGRASSPLERPQREAGASFTECITPVGGAAGCSGIPCPIGRLFDTEDFHRPGQCFDRLFVLAGLMQPFAIGPESLDPGELRTGNRCAAHPMVFGSECVVDLFHVSRTVEPERRCAGGGRDGERHGGG